MLELLRRQLAGRVALAVVTERDDGDVHPERVEADILLRRQIALTDARWVMVDQVHGTDVVIVDDPVVTAHPLTGIGDVILVEGAAAQVAIWAADCAPIALFGSNGAALAVAHAGWRGLADGVLDVAVDALESTGATVAAAVLGPCIHGCCNEFGSADLDRVAAGVGAERNDIVSTTEWGTPGLDVPTAVARGLDRRGVTLDVVGACTGCDDRFRSHRRRDDVERHALIAWFEEAS
jgi:copper oxidase (laccase) domain-containing protein